MPESRSYLPATSDTVASFVAHLHLLKYSPSTISSHLSAIALHRHKTKKTSTPCSIIIPSSKSFCPVTYLKSYLSLRGNSKGPLFILANNSSLTLGKFKTHFMKLLHFVNLSPKYYKFHSIRIGACTQAVISGKSEQEIMLLGRWKSKAFRKYIRLSKITS
ncbi:hypothetical protein MAR_008593 [Mya arenaria]|uniref:Tyr recombinase domain-containing protein n=1 Tax=Mya arenaria TaxID=6604 RepID=A0ABY7DZD8_MYAAR|nr:hypothetical protein MAR_008593 [Mya arenaria]